MKPLWFKTQIILALLPLLLVLAAFLQADDTRTVYLVTNTIESARVSILNSAAVGIPTLPQANAYAYKHGAHVFEITIRQVK
jgi:hypothetical protein